MRTNPQSTVREIVVDDFRAAAVLHDYGIDFCCGGNKTMADACQERNVRVEEVLREVTRACRLPEHQAPGFTEWETDELIAYIVSNHHGYVRRVMPIISAHLSKAVASHGSRVELSDVARLFESVVSEMTTHMAKEENILFPYIAALAEAVRIGEAMPSAPFGDIEDPIRVMETEHESAGAAMALIRSITGGYEVPVDACVTYRVCLQELEAFERDLHQHVHLENNVLFPRARALASA